MSPDHSKLFTARTLLVAGPLFLQACSPSKANQAAVEGVTKFHGELDAEQYHEIFSQASPEFQKSGTETELTQFFSAVHRKLGNVQNAHEQGFFINFNTGGTIVTLTYQTDFAGDSGAEQFVWRVGDQPSLISYRVDSRALVTK